MLKPISNSLSMADIFTFLCYNSSCELDEIFYLAHWQQQLSVSFFISLNMYTNLHDKS